MSSRSESRRDQRYQMNIRMIHESDWERRVSVSLIHSWWADFDFGWSSACSAALKAAFRCGSAPEVPQGPKPTHDTSVYAGLKACSTRSQSVELFNPPSLVVKLLRATWLIASFARTPRNGRAPTFKWPSLRKNSAMRWAVLRRG